MKLLNSLLLALLVLSVAVPVGAAEPQYALNIYGGKLTKNDIDDFIRPGEDKHFVNSYLLSVGLARRIGGYRELLSYEIEGQIVKHFDLQKHWEFNALVACRWEKFPWDETLETSIAVGIGPSFASETPKAEVSNEGDSQPGMVYMMFELALGLPSNPEIALITRIHHRSEAFGLIADEGGSNAFAVGLKYRF